MIEKFDALSKEQKQEWYSALKVGDVVVLRRYSYGYGRRDGYFKTTVKSITKTGRINVEVANKNINIKATFTKEGRHYGKQSTYNQVYYELRPVDNFFLNYRRKVIAKTMFEESMKKLENSYSFLETIEDIERYADVIGKALKELNL